MGVERTCAHVPAADRGSSPHGRTNVAAWPPTAPLPSSTSTARCWEGQRTLFTEALIAAGLLPDRHCRARACVFKAYEVVGETLVGMALARRAAGFAAGWNREVVQEAAAKAAESLAEHVLALRRAAGRRAPRGRAPGGAGHHDALRPGRCPWPSALGFDDVVATRYGVDDDGRYTGGLDGEFVWVTGKLAAVRRWAERARRRPASRAGPTPTASTTCRCWRPSAIPTAVNPDPRLRVLATLRRWPMRCLDVPPGVPKLAGFEPIDMRPAARPGPRLFPYARFDIAGVDHIPPAGPAIIVANHRSYFDTAAVGSTVIASGADRSASSARRRCSTRPVVGQLARAMGGIRVERGTRLRRAAAGRGRGAGGGRAGRADAAGHDPAGRAFFDPVLKGRLGRRPPGGDDEGARHPDRPVGHREGVAPHARACPTSPT